MSNAIKLARGWKTEISISAVLTEIKGITSTTLSPSDEEAVITTREDAGWKARLIAERSMDIKLEGFRVEDGSGVRDPGQAAVEALAREIDAASLGTFRVTSPGGETWDFNATASVDSLGGGLNDGSAWNVTLHQSGEVVVTAP